MRLLDIPSAERRLDSWAPRLLYGGLAVAATGLIGAAVTAAVTEHGLQRLLGSYLVSFAFLLTISLGALFFVLLHHLCRAGWSVTVRRLAEGMAGNVQLMALLAIPIVLGMPQLYHWSHRDVVAADPVLAGKSAYLNPGFFVVRLVVYFAVWTVLARFLLSRSVEQDASGDPGLTLRLERWSAPGMLLFALTVNFASFDLLMSLDPHWFSTIFGVYVFSGAVVGFLALMPVALLWLQRQGKLSHSVTQEHYHDLGKMLFAFVVFWAYIAFSQYMLIWYANLPEEAHWYLKRQSGGWAWVSLTLLFGHFLVPFLFLLSRVPKRRPALLAAAGVWLLAMHWLDLYWLVMPELGTGSARPSPMDPLCLIGLGGLWVAGLAQLLRHHSLLPERDPRLSEALALHGGGA